MKLQLQRALELRLVSFDLEQLRPFLELDRLKGDILPSSPFRIEPKKRGERKISLFIGKELLYDYLSNVLDKERQQTMSDLIKESEELRVAQAQMTSGLKYIGLLAQTSVRPELIESLREPPSYLTEVKEKIHFFEWPPWLRWSAEAMTVGIVVSIFVALAPWQGTIISYFQKREQSIVIANYHKSTDSSPKTVAINSDTVLYSDEGQPEETQVSPKPAATPTTGPTTPPATAKAPSQTVSAAKAAPIQTAAPQTPTPSTEKNPTTNVGTATPTPSTQGILYRGSIKVVNLEMTNPKIVALIESYGGRKAGEVVLGWERAPKERYFHFTMPTAKLETLKNEVNQYGSFNLTKEKHERVMPEGISRFIIVVTEGAAQ